MAKKSFMDSPALRFITSNEEKTVKEEKIAPKKEELPKGYKISPVYIETKSRRLQLLLKSSIFIMLNQTSVINDTSVYDLVNSILEESLN